MSLSLALKNTEWGCLRRRCWGEYMDQRVFRKWNKSIIRSFINCVLHQILLVWWNQWGQHGGGGGGTEEISYEHGHRREKTHLEDLDVDCLIISEQVLKRRDGSVWTGFILRARVNTIISPESSHKLSLLIFPKTYINMIIQFAYEQLWNDGF